MDRVFSIVPGIVLCILFLTMKGKNAEVPPGYQVNSAVTTSVTMKT